MTGVVAEFETVDALLHAVEAAKARHLRVVTIFSPAYDHRIVLAADAARTSVPRWVLAGGIIGAAAGLGFTIWTVRQWPILMVGGKPLVSLPPFLVIAFELTILLAACAAFVAFVAGGRRARRMARFAYDPSFSEARFALLLACPLEQVAEVGASLVESGAATWRAV